jgi:hypothetical protein
LASGLFCCPGAAGWAEVSVPEAGGAGFDGGGVCCAADGKEREIANTKAINGRAANFIDKHFPQKTNGTTIEQSMNSLYSHSNSQIPVAPDDHPDFYIDLQTPVSR